MYKLFNRKNYRGFRFSSLIIHLDGYTIMLDKVDSILKMMVTIYKSTNLRSIGRLML